MASWRSWWTALSLAVATQVACGGESAEEPDDSNSGKSNGGASAGSSASGRGGTAGRSGSAGRATGGDAGENTAGETNTGGSLAGSAGTSVGGGPAGIGGTGTSGNTSISGSGGSGGNGGSGGSGVPFGWHCSLAAYGDGDCDCGCGDHDVDCGDDYDIDDCENCDSPGNCNGGECPGKIDEEDLTDCTLPPLEWTCPDYAYLDFAVCDCGCGLIDPDCEDDSIESCDICNLPGSCSANTCPASAIDAEDNSHCDIPEGWTCTSIHYRDSVCDCGCGVVDDDCSSPLATACEQCYYGCAQSECIGPIDAANNAICTGVPVQWTCAARFYDDGALCHCGCGVTDPDCADESLASCDRCDFEGSCSARTCPGTIDPDDNALCEHPPAPQGWLCASYRYADGYYCDCGCGVEDLDCATNNDVALCDQCYLCGSNCDFRVNPDNIAQCIDPPDDWVCDDNYYGDGYYCTCGCGAPDPDCDSPLATACTHCPEYAGSCSDYSCREITAEDNTRCTPAAPGTWVCRDDWYGDGACDCGCGAVDSDCANANASACDFCPEGSCSPEDCSTIVPTNNAACAG